MENHQLNYNIKAEPILTQGGRGEDDDNEDELIISSYFQELMYPEPGCIDTLMKPNPNPEEDELHGWIGEPAVDVVHQPNNTGNQSSNDDSGDGIVHDQPSSVDSSSSTVNANEPMSDLGPRQDVLSMSSVDVNSVENKEIMTRNRITRRKKPNLWTEEEHSAFLHGISHGFAGDWKNMSKIYVKTRSSTQIASHAQKYFKRQQNTNNRRRKSINDISVPSHHEPQLQMPPPEQSPKTRFSSTVVQAADLPPFSIASLPQPNPNPNPNTNTNPNWVLPVGTHQLPLLPPRPIKVEDARALCMARQLQSSSSNYMIPPHHPPPELSRLPQQNPRVTNYSLNYPPEYFPAEHGWRNGTIEHPHQQQTLASSWPQMRATCRNYDYYSSMPMLFRNPIELALQRSLRLDDNNAVGSTSQIPFNVDMGHAHLPNQDSYGDRFYP